MLYFVSRRWRVTGGRESKGRHCERKSERKEAGIGRGRRQRVSKRDGGRGREAGEGRQRKGDGRQRKKTRGGKGRETKKADKGRRGREG